MTIHRRLRRTGIAVVLLVVAVASVACGLRGSQQGDPVESPPVTAVSVGSTSTCAIADAVAYCWGRNGSGQLGDGTTTDRHVPTRVPGLSGVAAISAGPRTTCAVAQGVPYCWGSNTGGALGMRAPDQLSSPHRIEGLTNVTAIAASRDRTCAVADAVAYCWGDHRDETAIRRLAPTRVDGLAGVTAVAVGDDTTCAVADGAAYCWGDNGSGQIGDGTSDARRTPTRVEGLSGVTAITTAGADRETTCAIARGSAHCWGNNGRGQLGIGQISWPKWRPSPVSGLAGVTAISTGEGLQVNSTTCAVAQGVPHCWGDGRFGQIGDGRPDNRVVPTRVPALTDVSAIATSGETTCAIGRGALSCWGSNAFGQVGDGSGVHRSSPVAIRVGE